MANPDSISVTPFGIPLASVAADADVVALGRARMTALGRNDPISSARRVYCGSGGTLVVRLINDPATSLAYTNVANGGYVEGQIVKLIASGTTATNLIIEF